MAKEGTPSAQQQTSSTELVLLVPPSRTQEAYRILVAAQCVPRPWNFQGRYGSRTHKCGDKMGIPVLESILCNNQKSVGGAGAVLEQFMKSAGVQLAHLPIHQSNRELSASKITNTYDARIHPERDPATSASNPEKQDSQNSTARRPDSGAFTYAELFAGIGGFGVALKALGGTCVFCSELEESCRRVYESNHFFAHHEDASSVGMFGDIYQVPDEALPASLDLLVGGFPCQPFSTMGNQPGLEDPKGNLFLQIVRVLRISQPRAFLLENVPGLLKMKDTLSTIVTALEEVGYKVTMEVCNARGLTATSRKRLFLVGLRADDSCKEASTSFLFPYVPDLSLRAADVIDYDLGTHDESLCNLLTVTDAQMERLKANKRWKPGSDLAWPDTVCDTLVSHYSHTVGKGESQLVPTSSGHPRRFSPRECASIMGFPISFVLPSQRNGQGDMAFVKEQYRMLGNAVCPPLIAALAGAVLARMKTDDVWVEWGRLTAVELAYAATRTTRQREMPAVTKK